MSQTRNGMFHAKQQSDDVIKMSIIQSEREKAEMRKFVKKIESDSEPVLKCEIPGKTDGQYDYQRPWKL